MNDTYLKQIEESVVKMDRQRAEAQTREALEAGVDALAVLKQGLIPAMETVGDLFGRGDYFLPEMLGSVDAYNGCFPLLKPHLAGGDMASRGKILLGTVRGDIHDIGKNILAALLQGNGFETVDLGTNVSETTFLEQAREHDPDVICLSALLSTTIPEMKTVIDLFKSSGARDRVRIIVGGAPVTREYAESIGADGYGADAQAGVRLAREFTA